jgi:hypothetical protein
MPADPLPRTAPATSGGRRANGAEVAPTLGGAVRNPEIVNSALVHRDLRPGTCNPALPDRDLDMVSDLLRHEMHPTRAGKCDVRRCLDRSPAPKVLMVSASNSNAITKRHHSAERKTGVRAALSPYRASSTS